MSVDTCHYCGRSPDRTLNERGKFTCDLRPYGPGGSPVCFECATASPDRETEVQGRFGALLDATAAISPTGAVVLNDPGIRPLEIHEAEAIDAALGADDGR